VSSAPHETLIRACAARSVNRTTRDALASKNEASRKLVVTAVGHLNPVVYKLGYLKRRDARLCATLPRMAYSEVVSVVLARDVAAWNVRPRFSLNPHFKSFEPKALPMGPE
jgi:hypothetical protein